jgi:hypothetical protein
LMFRTILEEKTCRGTNNNWLTDRRSKRKETFITSTPRPFTYTLVKSSEGSGMGLSCKNNWKEKKGIKTMENLRIPKSQWIISEIRKKFLPTNKVAEHWKLKQNMVLTLAWAMASSTCFLTSFSISWNV